MVEVNIRGKQFPLCLTVAALDKINEKCGGLKNLNDFLVKRGETIENGEPVPTLEYRIVNVAWLLGLMIQEGEENRYVCARFETGDAVRRAVPDSEAIAHLLTPGAARRYVSAVYAAISESMHQDIEASHEKNVENAGQA